MHLVCAPEHNWDIRVPGKGRTAAQPLHVSRISDTHRQVGPTLLHSVDLEGPFSPRCGPALDQRMTALNKAAPPRKKARLEKRKEAKEAKAAPAQPPPRQEEAAPAASASAGASASAATEAPKSS